MTLTELYQSRVTQGDLTADPAQSALVAQLSRVADDLAKPLKTGWFAKKPDPIKGLYVWGGVGRGKSMLMDMFVDCLDVSVRRVHFHAFMQDIHAQMHTARQGGVDDALKPVADAVIADVRCLAFDEMQITDITDAMIVGRLFTLLHEGGVVVVTTSNRVPDDLYKDGLNRALFLPFIEQLKQQMVVWEMTEGADYRQNRLAGSDSYFTPLNSASAEAFRAVWSDLTEASQTAPLVLKVQGRDVVLPQFHNSVARAEFGDLCGKPLGPADYLAIAQTCKVLMLENIPTLGRHNFNEAKRFVTLVDALYEARVQLIATAAAKPEMLYLEGEGSFEFERTASRLREMQSDDWRSADQA
ncbi:cell division protein ZapE [Algirhabdus cladophorae]|uniref:cell division protein ZapE n=1 Tax=Algirhabdus cladophorae TaxID=3377108 RepID=UPI003B849715